jgi:hypothetical protein
MTKLPELFAPEPPVRSDFARRGAAPSYALRRFVTMAVLAGILGSGGFWLWNRVASHAPGEIPTIKAEGVFKQRPEQPGGIDIPHQDVQVYREIDGSAGSANAKPVIEHMLPPPEEPNTSSLTASRVAVPNNSAAAPKVETLTTVAAAPLPAATPSVPLPAQLAQPSPNVPTVAAEKPVAASPEPAVAAAPAAGKGDVVVQLASSQDENAAQTLTRKMQARYGAVLGAAHLRPVRADLGTKGVFYRIQSQPMAESRAQAICKALKNMKAGCLLVHS